MARLSLSSVIIALLAIPILGQETQSEHSATADSSVIVGDTPSLDDRQQVVAVDELPANAGWWDDRTGSLVGGLGGTGLGLLGGLIGVMAGVFRQWTAVRVLGGTIAAAGVASLIAGIIAVTDSQPYGVWYPLVLLGSISIVTGFTCVFTLHYVQRELELRRMSAMDVGVANGANAPE